MLSIKIWYDRNKKSKGSKKWTKNYTARYKRQCLKKIKPHTIGEKDTRGGNARDTRPFINGVFWILRTVAPWRNFLAEYGYWKNIHRRFLRWKDNGIWKNILTALIDDADFECWGLRLFRFCAKKQLFCLNGTYALYNDGKIAINASIIYIYYREKLRLRLVVWGHSRSSTRKYTWMWMLMVCRCDFLSHMLPLRGLLNCRSANRRISSWIFASRPWLWHWRYHQMRASIGNDARNSSEKEPQNYAQLR